VVYPGGLAGGAFEQDELERRLGDREVGVAGTALGGPGAEQPAVEGDRAFQVGDAQRELDTGHDGCSLPGDGTTALIKETSNQTPASLHPA
jgi:hypothetical protein